MADLRRIQMSLFLTLLLRFTAVTGQVRTHFAVRVGDDVTLPWVNGIDGQDKCDNTDWLFSGSENSGKLFERGQFHKEAKAKSDRLSVTANCSLVIKKVTVEDAGYYTCRQKDKQDANVYLFVINMTEHEDTDKVTFTCSVSKCGGCDHTLEWLFEGKDVDDKDIKTSQADCSVTVTFSATNLKQKSQYRELLVCKVTDGHTNDRRLFPFSRQSSVTADGNRPGEDATTASTRITAPANSNTPPQGRWWVTVVAVGLAALVIILVILVIIWKRATGTKTQMEENSGLSLNPAVTPSSLGSSWDTADPEDGVSYASISFIRKTNSKGQERVKNDDDHDDDAVTYSAVNASSSSLAGASGESSNLYATVSKSNK